MAKTKGIAYINNKLPIEEVLHKLVSHFSDVVDTLKLFEIHVDIYVST